MLEKLSPVSLKCFDTAKQKAQQFQSSELSTRHLLLGMLEHQSAWLAALLDPQQIDVGAVRRSLETNLSQEAGKTTAKIIVAAELKAALQQAITLACGTPVTPSHLLAGMLEVDPLLRTLLAEAGINIEQMQRRLNAQDATQPPIAIQVKETTAVAETPSTTEPEPAEKTQEPQVIAVQHKLTPTLDRYSRDLTRLAREGALHPIVGREREIAAMIEILCRTIKRNPMLVGEPGVGKTALAEGLAQRIVNDRVPALLRGRRLVELSVSSLVAGAGQVGEFEQRLQRLVGEVKTAGDVILFVDEAHALMGAGGIYGLQDASTILKPALARGDIVCIGATTTNEYRKYIEKDGALARRFQPVRVEEPGREAVLEILRTLKPRFEEHFGVQIPDPILGQTCDLAHNYLKNRFFPDKAIDLLERAASRTMLAEGDMVIQVDVMLSVLSDMTGIPLEKLDQGEMQRYLQMEEILRRRVIGQDQAIEAVASLVRLTKRRLDLDPKRPDGVFLFVGPTGVGKTELAKALTEFLFGDQERLIRLDMSEFSSEFTISRLIGSPPGYVGYDQGGQLTERVAAQPFCVLLLDEIEKAHPDVLNLFLQVFDDGRLTDAQGRTVSFADTTIMMTSNLASELWFHRRMGFDESERRIQVTEDAVLDILNRKLTGEFLSRIDEIVIFHPLDDSQIRHIAQLKLQSIIQDRFADQELEVTFEPDVAGYVAGKGYEPRQGCRRLERVIQREVLEPLAEQLYHPDWQNVQRIQVGVVDGRIEFTPL